MSRKNEEIDVDFESAEKIAKKRWVNFVHFFQLSQTQHWMLRFLIPISNVKN